MENANIQKLIMQYYGEISALDMVIGTLVENYPQEVLRILNSIEHKTAFKERLYQTYGQDESNLDLIRVGYDAYKSKLQETRQLAEQYLHAQQP